MGFLPKDYKIPDASSGYMKFEQGDNQFRVLSNAIIGTEYWIETDEGRRPVRKRPDERVDTNKLPADEKPKHFWAFVVWNYNKEMVQILEITQKTILRSVEAYARDEDYGHPKNYDLVIERKGEGLETEYTVRTKLPSELDEEIEESYEAMDINLEALYDNKDPFADIAEQTADDVEEALNEPPF